METQFSQEELRNLAVLVSKAPITGQESAVVALLLQKIGKLLEPPKVEEKAKKEV